MGMAQLMLFIQEEFPVERKEVEMELARQVVLDLVGLALHCQESEQESLMFCQLLLFDRLSVGFVTGGSFLQKQILEPRSSKMYDLGHELWRPSLYEPQHYFQWLLFSNYCMGKKLLATLHNYSTGMLWRTLFRRWILRVVHSCWQQNCTVSRMLCWWLCSKISIKLCLRPFPAMNGGMPWR